MYRLAATLSCVWFGTLAAAMVTSAAAGQCEVAHLRRPSGGIEDIFGASVSLHDNVAAICDPAAFSYAGAAYVFRHDSTEWLIEAVLKAPEPDSEGAFAGAVAVSGDVVVVSDYNADAPEFQSGAAYVYRYDADTSGWAFEATLTASDGDAGDIFGWSVSLDGNVALIGARDDDVDGVPLFGSAYVFRYNGTEWVEEAKLTDPDGEYFDLFGRSVSIKGHVAVVGAPGNDHSSSSDGSAFVFRYDGAAWVLEAELTAFDPTAINERFGWSASLAEDLAVVGAPYDTGHLGAAYVFRYNGEQWLEEVKLTGSDPVYFPNLGFSVSVSSDASVIVAGAPYDSSDGFESGAAHVFRNQDGIWNEVVKLTPTVGVFLGSFGISVSVYHDEALIGAPGENEDLYQGLAVAYAGMSGVDCNGNSVSDACDIFGEVSKDKNANSIPDECEAIGDLNGDGSVDVMDFLALLAAWGPCDQPCPPACTGDTNGDCAVDVIDFLTLLANWG